LLVAGAAGTWLCAQIAVNSQLSGGNARSVNAQVSTQVYGAGMSSSVRYAEQRGKYSTPMNSEVRHAYWKSGALPSDVRMGYAALGPMNPSGPLAYIPPKPAYLNKPAAVNTPPSRPTNYSNQSVRYSSGSSPNALPSALPAHMPRTASAASPQVSSALGNSAMGSSAVGTATVRYSR
jgi:hypothetical protein